MSARGRTVLRCVEWLFWVVAFLTLGLYALVYLDRNAYQAYEEWSFDRALQHEPAPVIGFLLHSIHFGGNGQPSAEPPDAYRPLSSKTSSLKRPHAEPAVPRHHGPVVGRIEIPRIGVHAMILDNTGAPALRRAVGHIEGTAWPGQPGNVGIAGHRDTFFRGLRNIRRNDLIRVTTLDGTYEYAVSSIQIVEPDDVQVLDASSRPTLTLVTCFPFDYIGSAPHRFIVHAREIGQTGSVEATPGS